MRFSLTVLIFGLSVHFVHSQNPENPNPRPPVNDLPGEPARREFHREGFSGRQPLWRAGESNVAYSVKDHRITTERYYNAPASEYLKIEARPIGGKADSEFIYFVYDTPKCPVSPASGEEATARVWVRGFRPGIQLRARVRLPRERDPQNPEAELSTLILGESYPEEQVRSWHPLSIRNPSVALQKQLAILRLQLKRDVDWTGAYIDQIILNVYAGPGSTELWIDDLDVGPCLPEVRRPGRPNAVPASRGGGTGQEQMAHPYQVEFLGGRILIDKKPFFMRAIRYNDSSMKELRDWNFNTVALPADAKPETIDDALRNNFLIVAGTPLASSAEKVGMYNRDADALADTFRRFRQGDGVLMWDLGGGRTAEQFRTVSRTSEIFRDFDPRRPRAINLWDGFSLYSDRIDVIGSHRFPLNTGLELSAYREWLMQRRALTAPGKLMWTWIQTQWPLASIPSNDKVIAARGQGPTGGNASTFPTNQYLQGPHPEQIRILTYLSLACGCRGLGFWADKTLTDPAYGRDRLLELYLLNAELELLEPILMSSDEDTTQWIDTSHVFVKAAVIRGKKGILVLPVWIGPGSQYCPDQGAIDNLRITVPRVPDGADPWLFTPATYDNLRVFGGTKSVAGGVEVTIPKFDLTAAIVFTNDHSQAGELARWQDNILNKYARPAARFAREEATELYEKTRKVHEELMGMGAPTVNGADEMLEATQKSLRRAAWAFDNGQPDVSYRESRAAMRPLRLLMREHWWKAARTMTTPTASPFAISYFTLPQHYQLARAVQNAGSQVNILPHGGFELSEPAQPAGAAVSSLPGWLARESHLDPVILSAAIVNVTPEIRAEQKPVRPRAGDRIPPPEVPPQLGRHCLMLAIDPKRPAGVPPEKFKMPEVLERAAVAVDTPAVSAAPGTWVRISFSANVPVVFGSSDGLVVFDSVAGEPLGVRVYATKGWVRHHLYRPVGEDGTIRVTFALTGLGKAFIDDVKIEELDFGGNRKAER